MRQRITFVHDPQDSIDPKALIVDSKSLKAPGELNAAREDRITFSLSQLPQELYRALRSCHEIHLRWTSPYSFPTISPFSSRVSPGLHAFFTPQSKTKNSNLICPMLKKVFGNIDCEFPEVSFTALPNDRFSQSASHQYYSPLATLEDFTLYVQHKLCPSDSTVCLSRVSSLLSANQVDIDFDSISHALTITAFWSSRAWSLDLTHPDPESRLEIGILSNEVPIESEELSLAGFLTVVGEDAKPSPTLFSFPARHHLDASSTTFTSSFLNPTGLHPTLQLQISGSTPPFTEDERECKLHTYLTLPKSIFADKYQLSADNSLFLSSKNITALRYISEPTDLEAPVYAIDPWGSSLLLELSPPTPSSESKEWTAEIPLHLRYQAPIPKNWAETVQHLQYPPVNSISYGITQIDIPYPVVFWACTAEEGSKFSVNPFDRVGLGYEGLFGGRSMFFHLSPGGSGSGEDRVELINRIDVPVLELKGLGELVEFGTAMVVLGGFTWVMWLLYSVFKGRGVEGGKDGKAGKGKAEAKKDQ